jgi:oxygen-dependent protoporphyrinogen oxidase
MILTPKDSAAARNRFIYYPDHLVRMPGPGQKMTEMAWRVASEDIFQGAIPGLLGEFSRPPRPADLEDESVGSFLNRRLGSPHLVDNIVSAVLHGIYAGDIYQLSMKTLQPVTWHIERMSGSITRGMFEGLSEKSRPIQKSEADLMSSMMGRRSELARSSELKSTSIYSFTRGIGALSDALALSVKDNPKVRVRTGHKVKSLSYDSESDGIKVNIKRTTTTMTLLTVTDIDRQK